MAERMPSYGGQAVMEGVMMRGAHAVAIAMRAPNQEILIHKENLGGIYKSQLTRIPLLRGLIMLWDALGLGMRALTLSANVQTGEDEKLEGASLYLTLATSVLISVGLFFVLPFLVAQGLESWLGWSAWWSNLVEGGVRLLILVGYIWLVGKVPEIRRVFAYHGAEHKTINAYEAGADLTPENVSKYPLEHPRCGTSFLLTLVLLSILLFSLFGPLPFGWRLVSRIVMIPVLAMFAYEYIRWTANHLHWPVVQWLVRPNLALQSLTTREPSLDMLEVSIAAFHAMKNEERLLVS
jgi:uncharacterized protein YqhQ